MGFKLAAQIDLTRAPQTDDERLAVRQLKTALNRLGHYTPEPKTGITADIDGNLKDAVHAYQRHATIYFDDVDLGPGNTTERILADDLDYMERDYLFSGAYIWRTVGDGKVRGEHAHRNGQSFLWSDPPDGGHPGEDYNCRCWAENANAPSRVFASPKGVKVGTADLITTPPVDAITPVPFIWSAAAIFAVLELGGTVPIARILTAIKSGDLVQNAKRTTVDRHIFKKPEGVPDDWITEPANSGIGVKYIKPGTKDGTYVKVQKARPESSLPGQKYDNVRWQKNGQSLDINGNPVKRKSLESHIPIEKFKFDLEKIK